MRQGKSSGPAVFSIDVFCGADEFLFEAVGVLFDSFVCWKYPSHLNCMYLLPLYKGKGTCINADSHRAISLIHPLGRWFATCIASRL